MTPRSRLEHWIVAVAFAGLAIASTGGLAAAHTRSPGYAFAPYLDMTQYPAPNLAAVKRASGVRQATLAFITARTGSECVPTWGADAADRATGAGAYRLADIAAFRRAGGDPVPSFGGQAGTELASACPTEGALHSAYARVLATYRPTRIDFDIEGAALDDAAAITRRSEAIAALERSAVATHHKLAVSFTLPVAPSGLDSSSLAVLRSAVGHGVKIAFVNLMTMDYGDSAAPHPQGRMASYAIQAATSVRRQLHVLFPHLSTAARGRLIGLTPMIGVNDVSTETFTLSDARRLAAYARAGNAGMLAMWQLERDRSCAAPTRTAQIDCSSISQRPYEFAHALEP